VGIDMIVIAFLVYLWPERAEWSFLGEPAASGCSVRQTPKHGRVIMIQLPKCLPSLAAPDAYILLIRPTLNQQN
jgi:hypothetical protein